MAWISHQFDSGWVHQFIMTVCTKRRFISIFMLFVLGFLVLKPLFTSNEFAISHSDCLEFGHIHVNSISEDTPLSEQCHGAMLSCSIFLPVAVNDFSDLILKLELTYPDHKTNFYTSPYSNPGKKPPRYS